MKDNVWDAYTNGLKIRDILRIRVGAERLGWLVKFPRF